MRRPSYFFLIWLIALLESRGVWADTNKIQEMETSARVSVTNQPPGTGFWKQLQTEYRSAEEAYEKLLRSNPPVYKARESADKAEKELRATILREREDADQQLALLQTNMDVYVKAYLASDADFTKLQTATNKVAWSSADSFRRYELYKIVGKLNGQPSRSAQEEADIQKANEELVPLNKRHRALEAEKKERSRELLIIHNKATRSPEYLELGRRYMELQVQMWGRLSDSKTVHAANENVQEKKKLFENQLAQHPELLQAKRRRDEAKQAYEAPP